MKEIATQRNPTALAAGNRHVTVSNPGANRSVDWMTAWGPALLQRKAACPCGGGCPTCSEDVLGENMQTKLRVSGPADPFEQEADEVADQVMRMPDPALPRQVNNSVDGSDFSSKEVEQPPIQSFANNAPGIVASPFANSLGSGEPLDTASRAYFEPRFGRNFSGVRIHTDARAAELARSVNARAYALGRDIVFGAGEYAPGSPTGRRLLAHELTHTLQQSPHSPRLAVRRRSQDSHSAGESAETGAPTAPFVSRLSSAPCIARQGVEHRDAGAPAGAQAPYVYPPAPPAPGPLAGHVCGPDVTAQIQAAINLTRTTFNAGSDPTPRVSACRALTAWLTGGSAWDIDELHTRDWVRRYRPACAFPRDRCGSSAQVGSSCHYMGSANYVIYGVMFRLCHDHFQHSGSNEANNYTINEMLDWISLYKGYGILGLATPDDNFFPSREWASAGYRGWPSAATPRGDRSNCAPTCPTPFANLGGPNGRTNFMVHWVPYGWF